MFIKENIYPFTEYFILVLDANAIQQMDLCLYNFWLCVCVWNEGLVTTFLIFAINRLRKSSKGLEPLVVLVNQNRMICQERTSELIRRRTYGKVYNILV